MFCISGNTSNNQFKLYLNVKDTQNYLNPGFSANQIYIRFSISHWTIFRNISNFILPDPLCMLHPVKQPWKCLANESCPRRHRIFRNWSATSTRIFRTSRARRKCKKSIVSFNWNYSTFDALNLCSLLLHTDKTVHLLFQGAKQAVKTSFVDKNEHFREIKTLENNFVNGGKMPDWFQNAPLLICNTCMSNSKVSAECNNCNTIVCERCGFACSSCKDPLCHSCVNLLWVAP